MANVLNPETESTTLNTALETPTLEPATELERPLQESTSTPESSALEATLLDADAPTQPAVEAELSTTLDTPPEEAFEFAAAHAEAPPGEPGEDFSSALAAFEREQAAEAAAVEVYGNKVVAGKVVEQREKYLVVDVGLKSEGLVPLEQVTDHTGAVKFQPGDDIEVVIEREEPEGGYLVSYERAQRLRVWDTIEKAANEKTSVKGIVVSRVKGGLTVDIGIKAFLPGSQLEIRPVRNLDAYLGRMAVCAEAVALGRAVVEIGDAGIETIVAVRHPPPGDKDRAIKVVSPCGACRELIFDYDPKARVIVPNGISPAVVPIGELLPNKYSREPN